MNKRQVIGWLAACTLLLSGCGAKPAGASGAAGTAVGAQTQAAPSTQGTQDAPASQAQGQGQQQGQHGKRPAMKPQQMQMMETFQALLTMDKKDALSITKDEAAKLLPVVQDVVKAGQISDDQISKLREPLTDDQKTYMDSFADNMKQRAANRKSGGGKQAAGEGGQKQADSGSAGSGTGGDGSAASNGASSGDSAVGGGQGQGRTKSGSGGPRVGNRNIGQQLIDLLQSKTK